MENQINNDTYILIPVFNEATVIGDFIQTIKNAGYYNIIVVNDGSTDSTEAEVKKTGVRYLCHSINRGKGAAIRTGFKAARLLGAKYVITLDGDRQNNPEEISKIEQKLTEGFDVILGSRFLHKQEIPVITKVANNVANFLIFLLFNTWVTDSQGGFRGYSIGAISKFKLRHDRYEFDSEVIKEIAKNKLRYCEVPVSVYYTAYTKQKAVKQNILTGIKTYLKMLNT